VGAKKGKKKEKKNANFSKVNPQKFKVKDGCFGGARKEGKGKRPERGYPSKKGVESHKRGSGFSEKVDGGRGKPTERGKH